MKTVKQEPPVHPGIYIRQSVLPSKISVKKAAEMLGVGRPALSNLLNGKASLSPEMAMRIEKAFHADRTELLEIQARYEEFESREREDDIAVRAYAPPYLQILARQIVAWSETIEARAQLPALLRMLIHSTADNLSTVDFPAFDNSQRKGWDGQLESESATPWIPRGKSGWEFGCDKDARRKAESDYGARTSVPAQERKTMTFVFVTPKNWPGKEQWVRDKKALREWKDVKAFDASDLEQWLEQSIPAQTRFEEFLGGGTPDICSLDKVWCEWATVTEPELSKELFHPAVERHTSALEKWFKHPPSQPFVVTADSPLEALAFLSCVLDHLSDVTVGIPNRTIVIRSIDAFNRIAKISSNFVAVIASPEVEQALAGLHKRAHTIIVRGRNTVSGDSHIELDLLGYEGFKNALTAMGLNHHQIEQLARESGKSPTILRRRLAQVPAVQVPLWAEDHAVARKLIPLMFVGAWDSSVRADRDILSYLTDGQYREVEETLAHLLRMHEPPVWSVGNLRGVVSKIDTLYAIYRSITQDDLDNLLLAAEEVLSEEDPALDLPEDKRWAANLYGKSRGHSSVLRNGLCDTLVLMAVHGNTLFGERLGMDLEAYVNRVVRDLLTPSASSTWLSQKDDLPKYAEAAPDEFLTIVEDDLKSQDPQVSALLAPADSGIFGRCPRTGLLWALELLAWKPERLIRVTSILARLCEWKIDDHWMNKPQRTLASIFRFRLPQTATSVAERNRALKTLTKRFPDVGWQVCVDQFNPSSTIGPYNARPRWRSDAHGAGAGASWSEREQAQCWAIDLALDWPAHNERTLGDLVERLGALNEQHRARVWDLISAWHKTGPIDSQKAVLRERIRRYALTQRSRHCNLDDALRDCARKAYVLLEPKDPVVRHGWLFLRQWMDVSTDEIKDAHFDYHKRLERIAHQRREALREVWSQAGFEGIKELCRSGDASFVIGWHMAEIITDGEASADFLQQLLLGQSDELRSKLDNCITGFLEKLDREERNSMVSKTLNCCGWEEMQAEDVHIRLLRCAPFDGETWHYVDGLPENVRRRYWKEVDPRWGLQDASEMAKLVDELLKVDRPRAAFHVAEMAWEFLDTAQLIRLLTEVGTNNMESSGHYRLESYSLSEALDVLEERGDAPRDELVRLEFMFMEALSHSKHGIRNLEERLSETPTLFMEALALASKRSDGDEDPPGWRHPNPDHRPALATAAYSLLTSARRVPGTQAEGTIDLAKLKHWLDQVRSLCREFARVDIGDLMIGQLLSHCPIGDDGAWPCEPVREAIEDIGSHEIARGMEIGIHNSRDVTLRGEGGTQERELAARYRNWSRDIAFEYPFTSNLLEQIARSYDRDAQRWDTRASIRQRLED